MTGSADFHCHSTCSDGFLSPEELVIKQWQAGVTIMSLTDHDTTEGLEKARMTCREKGITFINGIELSASFNGVSVDILGYGFDETSTILQTYLKRMRDDRTDRMERMLELCRKQGASLTKENVLQFVTGSVPARPHLAKALVHYGFAHSIQDAFSRYVGSSAPCYVPKREEVHPLEAASLIQEAGGFSVIAHPVYYGLDPAVSEWLRDCRLDGIEIYHRDHHAEDIVRYQKMAEEAETDSRLLLKTGGTDYHHESFGRPGESLGASPLPYKEAVRILTFVEGGLSQ
ncbi:PHP domain-containing protein [Bacillus daqingensis]|uniref:PHP domain-containing protein n=1 Tax=Bacillus daqingensis TaxID=872396 RepID=A0ABV9NVX8_9BACI